jgi:hypothetical protein
MGFTTAVPHMFSRLKQVNCTTATRKVKLDNGRDEGNLEGSSREEVNGQEEVEQFKQPKKREVKATCKENRAIATQSEREITCEYEDDSIREVSRDCSLASNKSAKSSQGHRNKHCMEEKCKRRWVDGSHWARHVR